MLFQPRTFFVIEQAWIEPIVLVAYALALLVLSRRRGFVAAGVALGILAVSKQYSLYLLVPLFFALAPRTWPRVLGVAAAVAAAVLAPFAIWDFKEFLRDILSPLHAPFRMDALSLPAAWARLGGRPGPVTWMGPLAGAALLPALGRRVLSPAPAAGVSGAALLVVLLWFKYANCNYYWLCAALLAAAATPSREQA